MVGAVPPPRRTGAPRSVTSGSPSASPPLSPGGGGLLPGRPGVRVEVLQGCAELGVGDLLGRLPRGLRRKPASGLRGARVGVPEVPAEVLFPELARGAFRRDQEVRLDASLLDAPAPGRVVASDGELEAAAVLELD